MAKSFLIEIRDGLLHLFYPRLCEGCNQPLTQQENVLCISCRILLPETSYHTNPNNETVQRFAGRFPFEYATSFCYFTGEGLLQHLLHSLKYKGKQEIGIYLGEQLARNIDEVSFIKSIDMIVPVPLHPKKQTVRGYNQSTLIAEGLSNVLNIPVAADALVRTRHTESQTNKTRSERIRNMESAFGVNHKISLTKKHILICDDVLTTGATIESCAIALLKPENVKISIVTIGIAV